MFVMQYQPTPTEERSKMTGLPAAIIKKDHSLAQATEQLAELRWFWTRNKDNPNRVSIQQYAKEVGVHHKVISNDGEAWEQLLKAKKAGTTAKKGAPKTVSDFRKLAELGEERAQAAKAIAEATGISPAHVVRRKSEEITNVVNAANARVARKKNTANPTTIEHEIKKAATDRAKRAEAAKTATSAKKKKRTVQFLKIEGKIAQMIARGGEILDIAEGIDFDDDETQLLTEVLGKLRALLNLLDIRIAGETDIDWDAEFQKITV